MNANGNVQIPAGLIAAICKWLARVTNAKKTRREDPVLDDAMMMEILTDTVGIDPTFAVFLALDGQALLGEIRSKGLRLPANVAPVFAEFARTWNAGTPRCEGGECGMPAIRPLPNMTGVEALEEGTVCHWCDQGNVVRIVPFEGSIKSWVTGEMVPTTQAYDDTFVPGTTLPLQESGTGELRQRTDKAFLEILDGEKVLVRDFLTYLRFGGGSEVFGVSRAPLALLVSIGGGGVMAFGRTLVVAQAIAAKNFRDGNGGGFLPRQNLVSSSLNQDIVVRGVVSRTAWLPHDTVHDLHNAAVGARLNAEELLGGMDGGLAASLPCSNSPSSTMFVQLSRINAIIALGDGSVPLAIWLRNAIQLAGRLPEAQVFRNALDELRRLAQGDQEVVPSDSVLLDLLCGLLAVQFTVLVFKLRIPDSYLSGSQASQATRATEVMRYHGVSKKQIHEVYLEVSRPGR